LESQSRLLGKLSVGLRRNVLNYYDAFALALSKYSVAYSAKKLMQ